jgi:hypothetical protein
MILFSVRLLYYSGMSGWIRLAPHLEVNELERRYRAAKGPHERSWWQLARGQTASQITENTGYSQYWIVR